MKGFSKPLSSGQQTGYNQIQPDTTGYNQIQPDIADKKQAIVSFITEHRQVKVADLINAIGLSDGRIRVLLRELASEGTIEKIGSARQTYYIKKGN
ncbi:MAG: hypothetical protein LBV04_03310 [Deferribacteraceae bacterium]|nr:hypothetical protein [Deferribacteraceae bacterium]